MTTTPNAPVPDPFASVVSAKDIYDATRETQQEVRRALDRLDTVDKKIEDVSRVQAEHRARLDAIDRWRYAIPVASISAVASAIAAIIIALLSVT